uniref:Uncharacterized protein n=1 Tax=Pipistrellus kuhlii TaxID=59472 RepID=A0A7J7WLM7_PIPKU|nr:hypothetical protein mPipKuh1_007983 [Pipistrellus kuhlii]
MNLDEPLTLSVAQLSHPQERNLIKPGRTNRFHHHCASFTAWKWPPWDWVEGAWTTPIVSCDGMLSGDGLSQRCQASNSRSSLGKFLKIYILLIFFFFFFFFFLQKGRERDKETLMRERETWISCLLHTRYWGCAHNQGTYP